MYDFLEHFSSCKKYIIIYHSEVVSEFVFLRCIFIPENILFMKATIVKSIRIFGPEGFITMWAIVGKAFNVNFNMLLHI